MVDLLRELSEQQKAVCLYDDNILLTACPGSGKTRTIVHRLAYYSLKYSTSRKLNIAITYTNRASDEMEKRLADMGIDANNVWTGTIHQFCMKYIIRPYSMYSDRLRFGYRVIDEYEQKEYGRQIAEELNIEVKYDKYFENNQIVQAYKMRLMENREIDFDDILEVSSDLLKNNAFISENISQIIRSISVDEYQDTNKYQYEILSLIYKSHPNIKMVFVGDSNQAIYGSLGGVAKSKIELEEIFDTSFKEMYLTGCYRSPQKVIDFYSNFAVKSFNVQSLLTTHQESNIIYDNNISKDDLNSEIAKIISEQINKGIKPSEICVLAPQWFLLYPMVNNLRKQLPNVSFDAPDISPFKYDPLNPFYLIAWLLYSKAGSSNIRKKRATELLSLLKNDYGENISETLDGTKILYFINKEKRLFSGVDGIDCLKVVSERLLKSLKVNLEDNSQLLRSYKSFLEKTELRIKNNNLMTSIEDLDNCFQEKNGVVVTTIHSVKGEEYSTVIAFGLLQGYIPNWKNIFSQSVDEVAETNRLLYVLFSRSKGNIYCFSETGRKTKKGGDYSSTELLSNLFNDNSSFVI